MKTLSYNFKPIQARGPLAAQAYEALKAAIIQGRLAPGTRLQEEQLTQMLAISRTPLREAFNRLDSEGFIEFTPRKGAHIAELSAKDITDLFEAREVIETAFFIRSVEHLGKERIAGQCARLREAEAAMVEAEGDPDRWEKRRRRYLFEDRAIHDLLISACGNSYWEKLYMNLRDRIELYGNRISFDPHWFGIAMADHRRIMDALEGDRPAEAKAAMVGHVRNMKTGVSELLAKGWRP